MNNQDENQIPSMNSTAEQTANVGKALRAGREQLGLSINDVANRIKFAPRQIESLEAGDYANLPEAAFVRGFVRSYARLLAIDPASLLAGLPSSHTQTATAKMVKSVEIPMPSAFSARRHNVIWLAAALVIALSLAIFVRMHDRVPEHAAPVAKIMVQALELPKASTESATTELPETNQAESEATQKTIEAVPVSKQAVRLKPDVAAPMQPAIPKDIRPLPVPAPKKAVPPQANVIAVSAVIAASAPAAVELPKVNAEIRASEHALLLEFDQDAWVEIKDGGDKILLSRMHTAGSLVRVTGKAPMSVVIGNAHAVRLFDNGKKVNLERYTTAEVAKVKLK